MIGFLPEYGWACDFIKGEKENDGKCYLAAE